MNNGCSVVYTKVDRSPIVTTSSECGVVYCNVLPANSVVYTDVCNGHSEVSCKSNLESIAITSISENPIITTRIKSGAVISAAVVCEVNNELYLRINPEYLWIFEEEASLNDVYSNTHWNVD